MIGTVIVGRPDLDEELGLTEPGDSLSEDTAGLVRAIDARTRELLDD